MALSALVSVPDSSEIFSSMKREGGGALTSSFLPGLGVKGYSDFMGSTPSAFYDLLSLNTSSRPLHSQKFESHLSKNPQGPLIEWANPDNGALSPHGVIPKARAFTSGARDLARQRNLTRPRLRSPSAAESPRFDISCSVPLEGFSAVTVLLLSL